MMLVGLVWAVAAPLSLVALVWLLAVGLRRVTGRSMRGIAALAVLLPVGALWWSDHADFRAVCAETGVPVVHRRASAEGVFLNSSTANSFGMRYLREEGFAWIEAPSLTRRDGFVRYARSPVDTTEITTTEIPALTARYEVREVFSQPLPHTGLSQTQVVDRETGVVLATAGRAHFSGGRVTWLLGAWGSSDCPSARDAPDAFAGYYHLAKRTLR